MKCFVLAGGTSDRLWPLSRKNYPKQFMEIRDHRSMFQETILRNIPFCDEFVILAGRRYESVLQGQLQAFQRLRYGFIFEEKSLKTALPVTLALLRCKEDEDVLIVSTDSILEGDYQSTVMELKKLAHQNKIGVVGASVVNKWDGYSFIEYSNRSVVKFSSKRTDGCCMWDCGIVAGKAGVLLNSLDERFVRLCKSRLPAFNGVITEEFVAGFQSLSLGEILKTDKVELVRAKFRFHRIVDLKTYSDYKGKKEQDSFSLKVLCRNTDVVNTEEQKAIVLNNVEDLMVVNTRDAIYISKKESVADIKNIASLNYDKNPHLFDDSDVTYYNWGIRRTLYCANGYAVDKLTIYPHKEIPTQLHAKHTVGFSIVGGASAFITLGNVRRQYWLNQSVYASVGCKYRIENCSDITLTIIETRIGKGILDEDETSATDEVLVRMKPALRQCIWGGTNLSKELGKNLCGKKDVGESWELSAHPDGESVIADGKYAGKTLREFIEVIGKEKLGWKCQAFSEFPLLVKFIDAHQSLSIQVHPDDDYAFPNENEYGKNEMWYIISAKPGAFIYAGFNRDVTREEVARRIQEKNIEEILQKIPVHPGETYFLRAGTVHAIGQGCMICEIQQSSNITYRLYDYERKNKRGLSRELHVQKALDVLNYKNSLNEFLRHGRSEQYGKGTKTLLGECKYFSAEKYDAKGEISLFVDYSSFRVLVVLEGKGMVAAGDGTSVKEFRKGDTFFGVAHNYTFKSRGKISLISVKL